MFIRFIRLILIGLDGVSASKNPKKSSKNLEFQQKFEVLGVEKDRDKPKSLFGENNKQIQNMQQNIMQELLKYFLSVYKIIFCQNLRTNRLNNRNRVCLQSYQGSRSSKGLSIHIIYILIQKCIKKKIGQSLVFTSTGCYLPTRKSLEDSNV